MKYFYKPYKELYSVLTNGETSLEIICSKYGCDIDPGEHMFSVNGRGDMFIDGKPAVVEIRSR